MVSQHKNRRALFKLGRTVITRGALAAIQKTGQSASSFLTRHVTGDWGELDLSDRATNEQAIAHEDDPEKRERVLSAYRLSDHTRIWIITEHDRSVTTILLPDEH